MVGIIIDASKRPKYSIQESLQQAKLNRKRSDNEARNKRKYLAKKFADKVQSDIGDTKRIMRQFLKETCVKKGERRWV